MTITKEKVTIISILKDFIQALLSNCHQPEAVEGHQHQEGTLEASSFGRHSCIHKGEMGSPSTSCLSQTGLSHSGRLPGRPILSQLVNMKTPCSTACIYSTACPYVPHDDHVIGHLILAYSILSWTHREGPPSMQRVPNPGFSVRAACNLLMWWFSGWSLLLKTRKMYF